MQWLAFILVCCIAVRFLAVRRDRRDERLARARADDAVPRRPVALPAESPEQKLRREYVEGLLTVEQYERELDRLYGHG